MFYLRQATMRVNGGNNRFSAKYLDYCHWWLQVRSSEEKRQRRKTEVWLGQKPTTWDRSVENYVANKLYLSVKCTCSSNWCIRNWTTKSNRRNSCEMVGQQ